MTSDWIPFEFECSHEGRDGTLQGRLTVHVSVLTKGSSPRIVDFEASFLPFDEDAVEVLALGSSILHDLLTDDQWRTLEQDMQEAFQEAYDDLEDYYADLQMDERREAAMDRDNPY